MFHSASAWPLLEYLAYQAGCAYLSDLHSLNGSQRVRLARLLEQIPADAADLHTWNDALDYLAQAPPANTAEAARERLSAALTRIN